jgi:hypothetical protein
LLNVSWDAHTRHNVKNLKIKILGQEIKEDNKNSWGQQLAAGFLFQFCDYAKVAIISKVI